MGGTSMKHTDSYIFHYFPEEDFATILTAFYACTELPVQLIDDNGIPVLSSGGDSAFCLEFSKHLPKGESCQKEHYTASRRAINLGEAYIFECHSGLYHIAYPLISRTKLFDSVIAGPFLMDEPDADLILDLEKKYAIPTRSLLLLSDYARKVKVVTPEQVTELSHLLYYLTNSLIAGSRELQKSKHERLLQQSRINESIQMYKNSGFREEKPYPIEQENLLITRVKAGDIEEAKAIFNELLGILFLYENHNVENMKIRIIELCALLSRASIERGADTDMVLRMNNKLIQSIMASHDIYDIGYIFQDNMEIFTDSLFYNSDKSNRSIKKITEYIAGHFADNISLNELAEIFHLNPSYLSALFKQVTGLSFKDYLNQIRTEEAKRLLADTDYSIMEIAVACGFNDQSYFTKVFKKSKSTQG